MNCYRLLDNLAHPIPKKTRDVQAEFRPNLLRDGMQTSLQIVSLKAFGDFVIACHALRSCAEQANSRSVSLLAAAHLRNLSSALQMSARTKFLQSGSELPALFDLKRNGIVAGMRSLANLKQQLRTIPNRTCLLFDRIGWREAALAPRSIRRALPQAPNIYQAYSLALKNAGFEPRRLRPGIEATAHQHAAPHALIFPSSRVTRKTIPADIILAIHGHLLNANHFPQIVLLDGEQIDIPDGVTVQVIPRTFEYLIQTITAARLVVSADSLPAHLAEYLNVPVFVATPVPNSYWLPLSAFEGHAWSEFTHLLDTTNSRLDRFLARILP